jgi:hypothetical protein
LASAAAADWTLFFRADVAGSQGAGNGVEIDGLVVGFH